MANFGFQVLNTVGGVLVDYLYANMAMIQRGTIFNPNTNPIANGTINFPDTGGFPMVFVRGTGNIAIISVTATSFSYNIQNATGNVDYFVFSRPGVSGSGGFGLRVWDAASKLTFDSSYRYLNMSQTIALASTDVAYGGSLAKAIAGTNPFAVCLSDIGSQILRYTTSGSANILYTQEYIYGISCDNTARTATVKAMPLRSTLGPPTGGTANSTYRFSPQFILVADLTNFG